MTPEIGGRIVGHLPMEISRVTKFILDSGAIVTTKLSSPKYRRSPLVQGGFEISCIVMVEMLDTVANNRLLDKYLELLNSLYEESNMSLYMSSFVE